MQVTKICPTDINRPLPALLHRLNPVLLLLDPGVQLDLSISVQDRMATAHEMAPAKTPQTDLEMVAPLVLLRRLVADHPHRTVVRPRSGHTTCYRYRGVAVSTPCGHRMRNFPLHGGIRGEPGT
ncbi:hypothetical protein [Nocardia rhamnosiphila]